jgi:hypothetical protein
MASSLMVERSLGDGVQKGLLGCIHHVVETSRSLEEKWEPGARD